MTIRRLLACAGLSLALSPSLASAAEGDWIARLGLTHVAPGAESTALTAVAPDATVDVESDMGLGFSFTYLFRENAGFDILASLPFSHDIMGEGALSGLGKVGSVRHLPPTFSLQVYPLGTDSDFRPYMGLGVNYTLFFSEEAVAGISRLELKDSYGPAYQIGFDYRFGDRWHMNLDLRYIEIETDGRTDLGPIRVSIDPVVATLGFAWDL